MSNQYYFFGTRTTFIQVAPKSFCRLNGALNVSQISISTNVVSTKWYHLGVNAILLQQKTGFI